jgi:hypothetical protein
VSREEPLVKRGDLLATIEARPVEYHEVGILAERGGEGRAAPLVPPIHELLVEGSNRSFLRTVA